MPIYQDNYVAPVWVNGQSPNVGKTELTAMSQTLADSQVLSGNGAPGTSVAGVVGQLYRDESTTPNTIYQCVSAGAGGYFWQTSLALTASLAQEYDATKAYRPGDYCIHDGVLYQANDNMGYTLYDTYTWYPTKAVRDDVYANLAEEFSYWEEYKRNTGKLYPYFFAFYNPPANIAMRWKLVGVSETPKEVFRVALYLTLNDGTVLSPGSWGGVYMKKETYGGVTSQLWYDKNNYVTFIPENADKLEGTEDQLSFFLSRGVLYKNGNIRKICGPEAWTATHWNVALLAPGLTDHFNDTKSDGIEWNLIGFKNQRLPTVQSQPTKDIVINNGLYAFEKVYTDSTPDTKYYYLGVQSPRVLMAFFTTSQENQTLLYFISENPFTVYEANSRGSGTYSPAYQTTITVDGTVYYYSWINSVDVKQFTVSYVGVPQFATTGNQEDDVRKAIACIRQSGNPHAVTNSQIGLGNVENERQYSAQNPAVRLGTITLGTGWSGTNPRTQTVTVTGPTVTPNSLVELQFSPSQAAALATAGTVSITIENNAGTLTANAFGAAPAAAMTVQCTVEEAKAPSA